MIGLFSVAAKSGYATYEVVDLNMTFVVAQNKSEAGSVTCLLQTLQYFSIINASIFNKKKTKHLFLIKVNIGARVCNSMREHLGNSWSLHSMESSWFLDHKPINLSMPDMFNHVDD